MLQNLSSAVKEYFKKASEWYSLVFSIDELENSRQVQALFYVFWLGFYVSLHVWFYRKYGLKTDEICWPHFQQCDSIRFFSAYPDSYSGNLLYTFVYIFLLLSILFAIKKKWLLAHLSTLLLFLFKVWIFFFVTYAIPANFEHFHLSLVFFFLFFANKVFFTQRAFILMYFTTALVKLTESWIVGSYFTSLELGMPYVSDHLVPFFSNFVIAMETFLPWLFISKNKHLRFLSLGLFVVFHVYSILFVGYHYPTFTLLPLLVLFVLFQEKIELPSIQFRNGLAVFCLFFLLFINTAPKFIREDYAHTAQWQKYGLSMIDFNYQCTSNAFVKFNDGREQNISYASSRSMNRCGPYNMFFRLKKMCLTNENVKSISWVFNQSLNGAPFYELVRTENVCALEYHWLQQNDWIKIPNPNSQIVGFPAKNITYENDLKESDDIIKSQQTIFDTNLQGWIRGNYTVISLVWHMVWFCAMFCGLFFWGKPYFLKQSRTESRFESGPKSGSKSGSGS